MKRISLAVCLALMPFAADAAGLGKLTVLSGLGEPLNAEIELLSATKEELSSMTAGIAPAEVYTEQGVDRAAALGSVRVELSTKPDGAPVLRLVSSQPVTDPFLDMLIQVEWSSGRLLREYTALLDPPGYNDQQPAASAVSAPDSVASAEAATSAPATKSTKQAAAKPASQPEPEGDYKTRSGDTLHAIASRMQPEGVSLEQMLVGIYRSNKDAFAGENMNRLKVGKILRVPAPEELQAIPQQEAASEIRVQVADWNAYRAQLAGAVAQSEGTPEDAQGQSAAGKITAPVQDKAATEPAGPRDVVKLSKSDASTSKDMQARVNALQEEATARENAVKEANDRIVSLEKQIQDMQKLLQIKNQTLAEMQKTPSAEQKPAEPAAAAPKAEETPPAAAQPAPEVKAEEPKTAEPVVEEKPKEEQPKKKKLLKPRQEAPAPATEPGLMDDPLVLGGGVAALLALLGGGWFYTRNKRRKGLDSFEQGILTTGGLKPNTVFGNTAGGTVDTGDTSFLTDFSQGAGSGMIDTNDVDPIAEAEVYMAYGRDVQAEEILKDALTKDPKRFELHQKLLEIYANRKDNAAFETLAGELYSTLGSTDPHWAKVAELGHKLEPDNPLYSSAGTVSEAPVAFTEEDAGATMKFEAPVAAPESSLDFSLDAPAEVAAAPVQEDNSLDFDLGSLSPEMAEPAAAPAEESLPELDVDLGSDLPDLSASAEPAAVEAVAEADAGLDFQFELPEPAAEGNVQLDAVDLAPVLEAPAAEPVVAAEEFNLDLELPALETSPVAEMNVQEPVAEEPAVVASDFSLDLPEIAPVETAPVADMADQLADISFDLPEVEAPAAEAVVESAPDLDLSLPDIEAPVEAQAPVAEVALPDFDADQTIVAASPVAEVEAEEIVFDVPAQSADASATDLDFNFEVELGETAEPVAAAPSAPVVAVPDLDLSGISLDLDEPASAEVSAEPASEEITLSSAESPDVDTKLDLVTAYVDMGDTEGARELLEEVMREGGPQQRERAQGMLDSLS